MSARTFEDVVELVKSKAGECLSSSGDYTSTTSVLRFRCSTGHEWTTRATNILHRGRWCPNCGAAKSPPLTLDEIRRVAAERGGECLSEAYYGAHRKHVFRCAAGHVWEARPANLRHRTSWCPVCARVTNSRSLKVQETNRLAEIQDVAQSRLGRCLSDRYLGDKVHLHFECADGHRWWTTPNTIKRPHWCPLCKHGKQVEQRG